MRIEEEKMYKKPSKFDHLAVLEYFGNVFNNFSAPLHFQFLLLCTPIHNELFSLMTRPTVYVHPPVCVHQQLFVR